MSTEKQLTGYPSIDKPWLKYYDPKLLNRPLPKCTVYQNIYENNKEHLSDTAILYFGKRITYDVLFHNVGQTARALQSSGVQKGDVVNLCMAGTPEAIYLMLACNRLGAMANFINPLFTTEQMTDRLRETESKRIFVLDALYDRAKDAIGAAGILETVIISSAASLPLVAKLISRAGKRSKDILKRSHNESIGLTSWVDFLKRADEIGEAKMVSYEEEMPAIMVYSSGSTGASKGIVLTNDGINATIANYERDSFYGKRTDTFLAMIPVWFSTGIVLSILMPIAHGVSTILEPIFSKESFARDLMKYKPSMALAATSLWLYVATSDETRNIDLSQMNYPSSGGEKISIQDEKMLNEYLKSYHSQKELLKGYGMCELGSEVSGTTTASGYKSKYLGVGYPILSATVAAFDITTNKELPYGKHGELRVDTPSRMKCYFKNEDATNEFFYTDDNGVTWGCTGDIGYVDEDGEVFVLGRKTDSAVLENGKQVYLFDIEDVILSEPSLSGCKVVAVEENGTTVFAAHITVREPVSDERALIQKLNDICHSNLPEDECPAKYKLRDSFPVHPNGKRDIGALRAETDGFISVP